MAETLLSNPVIENFTVARRTSRRRVKVGVVTFPGSLDDVDAQRAVRLGGHEAVALWHGDHDLRGVDAVVLPGGFSYGDYLRCGAISRFSPVMAEVIEAARGGMPVLGICNGFQILCESHLLPGALIRNDHRKFVCRDQRLRIENARTPWTSSYDEGAEITIVLKNGEGGFVADDDTLDRLEGEGRVVARYLEVQPQRLAARHRRHHQRARQRGRPDAAPRARRRGPHRRRHRRPRLLHRPGRAGLRMRTRLDSADPVPPRSRSPRRSPGRCCSPACSSSTSPRPPSSGVRVFGMVHGVVFIAYCLTTLLVGVDQRWSRGRTAARPGSRGAAVLDGAGSTGTPSGAARSPRTWRLADAAAPGAVGTRLDRPVAWLLRNPLRGALAGLVAVPRSPGVALLVGPPAG